MAEKKPKIESGYLGVFDKLEDVVKARKRGEEMHDEFLKWYYSEHPTPKVPEKE